jgi:hypothetical protein
MIEKIEDIAALSHEAARAEIKLVETVAQTEKHAWLAREAELNALRNALISHITRTEMRGAPDWHDSIPKNEAMLDPLTAASIPQPAPTEPEPPRPTTMKDINRKLGLGRK